MNLEPCSQIFGENLKEIRKSKKMTRREFASLVDSSEYTIQGYEYGKKMPSLPSLLTLCAELKRSPNDLLSGLWEWRTELDDFRELNTLLATLEDGRRQKLEGLLKIVCRGMIETPPTLTGVSFGTRLQLLRVDAGFEIESLAKVCSIARSTLQGYESGQYNPSVQTVLRLSEILQVSPAYLLYPELAPGLYPERWLASIRPRQVKVIVDTAKFYLAASL